MRAKTAYIIPGSPWENGFIESFDARLRDELLDGEIFYSLAEARIIMESRRRHYNTVRPHQSLGYKPPAPEVFIPFMCAVVSATPTSFADRASAKTHLTLTFQSDQSMEDYQYRSSNHLSKVCPHPRFIKLNHLPHVLALHTIFHHFLVANSMVRSRRVPKICEKFCTLSVDLIKPITFIMEMTLGSTHV